MIWPTKKLGDKNNKRNGDIYYLMRDILKCFPDRVEDNLVSVLNQHLTTKETIRQILKNEVHEQKPQFRILAGALILQNDFLRQLPQVAFYEVIDIISELKYCFSDNKRKTLRRLSAQTILRLFAALYFEFCIMPVRRKEGQVYMNKFKKYFSKEDIVIIMNTDEFYSRLIVRSYGIELGVGDEIDKRIKSILDDFYSFGGK